jgi:hypothetical protein
LKSCWRPRQYRQESASLHVRRAETILRSDGPTVDQVLSRRIFFFKTRRRMNVVQGPGGRPFWSNGYQWRRNLVLDAQHHYSDSQFGSRAWNLGIVGIGDQYSRRTTTSLPTLLRQIAAKHRIHISNISRNIAFEQSRPTPSV